MIPGCERKSEQRAHRRGRGVEKRADARQRGSREGAGTSQVERKDGKQSDASRAAGTRQREAATSARRSEVATSTRQSGVATGSPAATPPGRQPPPDMCARSGQLRCTIAPTSSMQGCPSCKKTRNRLRGRKPNPLNLSVSAGVGSISGSIWGARLCWRPIFMPCPTGGAGP